MHTQFLIGDVELRAGWRDVADVCVCVCVCVCSGAITTLGRGGSDLSATVLGAALELDEVQVRTHTHICIHTRAHTH